MPKKPKDLLAELGDQLAADHVLEKAKAGPDAEFPNGYIEIVNLPPEDDLDPHERNLEKLTQLAIDCEFESGTLVGDIRDLMLRLYKERAKNWSQLSAGEQRDVVAMTTVVAKKVIRKIVRVIAEEDKVAIHASLKGYSASDGFDIKLKSNFDEETALELFRMNGKEVILTLADASPYEGQKKDPSIDEDQAPLPFADERPEPQMSNGDDSDLAGEDEFSGFAEDIPEGDVISAEDGVGEIVEAESELDEMENAQGADIDAGETTQAPDAEYLPVDDDGNDITQEQEKLWNKVNYVTRTEPPVPFAGESWVNPEDEQIVYWTGEIWSSDEPHSATAE